MAFKFLNRPEAKQRVLRMDLARTAAPKGKEGAERAIVVTAEADRLTYFWNGAAGEWEFHTRAHAPLRPLAFAPDETLGFPWSRRNGVAADGDLAVIAFKRKLDEERSGLFLDVLAWSEADAKWQFLTERKPLAVPFTRDCRGVGLDVWAWLKGNEVCLVVQAWFTNRFNPLQLAEPRLMLTRATLNLADLAGLEHQDAWQATNLDAGGFDLDARFDDGRIWVAHRRAAAAMSLAFNPSSNSAAVWMLDDAGTLNIDPSLIVADMPKTVVVSCELASATVKVEADDIPSVEHPQLQRIRPLILTGDRLRFVDIAAERDNAQWRLQPRVRQADKVAIWRGSNDWRVESIGPLDQLEWPRNLTPLAPSHFMVAVRDGRIAFATRLYCKPTFLWRFEVTQKGIELTFGREDRRIGGIACDRFLVTPDLPTGSVEWIGMSVLDLGHEQIALDAEGHSEWPVENTQFEGRAAGETDRAGGGTLEFFLPTVNTLGGVLVAHQDAGHGLCGYVGMGDGGGRVIFESKIDPIEPTITDEFKSLPVEVVSGPGGAGRAWVTLQAADFLPSGLPGYPVLYGDFMRTFPPPENGLDFTVRFFLLDLLVHHLSPRSLGGGLQPLIDTLPVANLLATLDSSLSLEDIAPPEFDLTRPGAAAIQASLATLAAAGAGEPTNSDATQPFGISFTSTPGRVQAGSPETFNAVTDASVTASTLRWTFTPPLSASLPTIQVQGAAPTITLPFDGEWAVRLRVDANDGRRSEINTTLEVAPSLWTQVWLPYREIGGAGGLRLGTTTLRLLRYRIQYRVGPDGSRESVHIDYLPEHDTTFRFDAGAAAQQGRTTLRLPIRLTSTDGKFDGLVGAAVTLVSADVLMHLERPFTLGVVTSDRRSFDVLQRALYAELDSTEAAPVTPEAADVETIRRAGFEPGRAANMTPGALAAKPVGATTVRLDPDDVKVEVALTPLASGISFLFGFIVALNLIGLIAILLVALLGPAAIVAAAMIGPLAVLVALAISAGAGWLFIQLAQAAATALAHSIARDTLTSKETVATITNALNEAGVMNYAGEGLAEAIAIKAIKQAIEDDHVVEPPTHEQPSGADTGGNLPPSGRERFRPQFFETVVVGEGACRVLLRVS